MRKPAEDVLGDLAQRSNISLHSDPRLVGAVGTAAAKADKHRAEKQAAKDGKTKISPLRRKPELQAVSSHDPRPVELTPWELLHVLGQAIALNRRGAARGLAEHWGALKYSQALIGDTGSFMQLSTEGKETARLHYKSIQSNELGYGFALVAAQRVLAQHYPDRIISVVPADTALSAGWAKLGVYRPQFFAELWKPDAPSFVIPIACAGNHSNAAYSYKQLASASAHAEAVHIGPWNETQALLFSTELPKDNHVTVHALHARGHGGWLGTPRADGSSLDGKLDDRHYYPDIQLPPENGAPPSSVTGFHVTPKRFEWFGQVLARTAAAGLTAFAGDGDATAQYLTNRQGKKKFTGFAHAAAGSVRDAHHTFSGTKFNGTDHVFRLNHTRVEAFSGVAEDLLRLLSAGRVEQYRREIYARRSSWPSSPSNDSWNGPVSVRSDGTVLAMRLLP